VLESLTLGSLSLSPFSQAESKDEMMLWIAAVQASILFALENQSEGKKEESLKSVSASALHVTTCHPRFYSLIF
jgi:hypothetical protein